ncbi:hypothetical protein [Olleya sp. HaHaR_3_96]|uniref:hypothetical protein n=1 Tax=Olleya sp. HaHaR_3_96 TaxID=2745560 RepID=UPI001C4E8122|nr:hypothetical protein [Olleya sp. HaHaR_3_96]QXP58793.1 hypothetical protein H0I26_12830 [Olleya sp. HaHaR_3_96]
MKPQKNLGIWMDHSIANVIDLKSKTHNQSIESHFDFEIKKEALAKSESLMHNKKQQMDDAYFKEISDVILNYENVILFGPTNAKTELHNYLELDSHFKDIDIKVVPSDKMSKNEKVAFVLNYFYN